MSQRERTGQRDLTYSRWHRQESTRRFLGVSIAAKLTAIDIDWCEACAFCSTPLALIETQRSGAAPKSARITRELAYRADLAAYSVSYAVDSDGEISAFRVQSIHPESDLVQEMSPFDYAGWLWALRQQHYFSTECGLKTGSH